MHGDLEQAAVARVLATYRGRVGERPPRRIVRHGSIAVSVPEGEAARAAAVLGSLDELGVVPARKLAQLFPDRAPVRAATLRTVLGWMHGQRADGGA